MSFHDLIYKNTKNCARKIIHRTWKNKPRRHIFILRYSSVPTFQTQKPFGAKFKNMTLKIMIVKMYFSQTSILYNN